MRYSAENQHFLAFLFSRQFDHSVAAGWVITAMLKVGYDKNLIQGCHNRTVVIDSHLGERENKQLDVVEAHGLRNVHLYEGEEWVNIRDAVGDLTEKFLCLNEVYPKRVLDSEAVHRGEILSICRR
jgi:hypothetical protein